MVFAQFDQPQQRARVPEHISPNLNLRQYTRVLLLDTEKALDSVCYEGLPHKLIISNIPLSLVKFIEP